MQKYIFPSGAPGPVDREFVAHAGNQGFDSHRRHMSERFFRPSKPGYPHPVCSELENSGFRGGGGGGRSVIAVLLNVGGVVHLIKTGKTVHVHAKSLQTHRERTHGADHGSVPLSYSENVVTRIRLQQQRIFLHNCLCPYLFEAIV